VNRAFDFAFEPLEGFPPLVSIAVWAILTALLVLLAYRLASNQTAIRRVKELLQAHLLEVRLFQDQPGVVWRAYAKLLRTALAYLGRSLMPLAVVAIPVTLLIVELEMRYDQRPLLRGETALVAVHLSDRAAVEGLSLDLPPQLEQTAPLVRIPAEMEVVAQIEPRAVGRLEIVVHAAGRAFSKEVVAGEGLPRVSRTRVRGGVLGWLLEPGEEPLPDAGPVASIEVRYHDRPVTLGPLEVNWLVAYFVLTFAAGLALKRFVGAEF
jgi:hypothetical protein